MSSFGLIGGIASEASYHSMRASKDGPALLNYYEVNGGLFKRSHLLQVRANHSEYAKPMTDISYDVLSDENLLDLATKLNIYRKSTDPFIKLLRETLVKSIDTLKKGIIIHKDNARLTYTNENLNTELDELHEILCDREKLEAYIKEKNSQKYLFDIDGELDVTLKIKPQYLEYINKYGFPDDGIFDLDKLSRL